MGRRISNALVQLCLACFLAPAAATADMPRCMTMLLDVRALEPPPSQYAAFCETEPAACRLEGDATIPWTDALHDLLFSVQRAVNTEIEFLPDWENSGQEELWCFPENGLGDCEDFALEKRRRLVAAGVPSAALTLAIAFHEVRFFPHAVLLVETTTGTWVLDNLYDDVLCWDVVPYLYTRREQPDGLWLRFER